jgi:hypothetical protein
MSEQAPSPAPTPAPTPAPAPAPAADKGWTAGLSEDHLNFAVTKGFDKDPNAVIQSYKHLEGLVGQKERVVLLPDEKDPASAEAFYSKIGRPEKPEGYGLQVDEKGDPKFAEFASKMFHEAGLSKKQAEKVVGKWSEYTQSFAAEQQRQAQEQAQVSASKLKTEWGNAYEQNLNIAREAAKKFGLTPDTVTALEKSTDFSTVMKFMHQVGMKVGEPDFVGGGPTGFGAMSPGQAQARKAQLLQDPEWASKFMNGGRDQIEEMNKLNLAIVGQ